MRARALSILVLSAALVASTLTLVAPTPAAEAASTTTPLESFDGGIAWARSSGSASTAASPDRTQGTSSLAFTYTLLGGVAEISPASPVVAPSEGFSSLLVDVKGNGSYNTLYALVTDATGEVFRYRVGTLETSAWKTVSLDLTAPPIDNRGGNANRVLDAPVSLTSFAVERNGLQPLSGTILLDDVRLGGDGWTAPTSSAVSIVPADGETAVIRFTAGSAGDYSLQLSDPAGRSRTFRGTVVTAGAQSLSFDGRADGGAVLEGLVYAALRYDTTPDGSLAAAPVTVGTPSIITIAEHEGAATVLEDFEDGGAGWRRSSGTVAIAASTDRTTGEGAVALSFDVAIATAEITPTTSPDPAPGNAWTTLKVDVKGDGNYSTVYAIITDATGEAFTYRITSLEGTAWKTVVVDLGSPAAAVGGNADKLLDSPLSLTKLTVVRNGLLPAVGKALLDNIRISGDGWTTPVAVNPLEQKNFVPSVGQTTTVSFTAATPGDYRLELLDATGLKRTVNGTAAAAGVVSVVFDGRSDSGALLGGTVSGILSYDRTPNGTIAAPYVRTRQPWLTGIAAWLKNPDNASIVGINGDLAYAVTAAESNQRTKLMEDAHVHYTREEFGWEKLEPAKGTFDWTRFDQMVNDADSRNLDLIGRLGYSSQWASSAPAGTDVHQVAVYPPTDLADFTDYVTATVHRYKGSVKVWEIWNEQNSSLFWAPAPDAHAYAAMLKAAAAAIKAEDPTATVVSGGLVGFDYAYVDVLRLDGALDVIDGFGIHTFVDVAPEASESITWLDGAEAYLERYAPGTKIWITELSWATCTTAPGCAKGVSEDTQAKYLARTYLDAAARGVAAITWWNLVEWGNTNSTLDNFGLVERGGRQKPGYRALVEIGATLDEAVVVGTTSPTSGATVVVDDLATTSGWSAQVPTGGTATFAPGAQSHGGAGGASLVYDFSGSSRGVSLQTAKAISGTPTALSAWVYGDTTNSPIYLNFVDATGEAFTGLVGNSSGAKWKRLTLWFDGGNAQYTGNRNGIVDYPVTFTGLTVYKSLVSGLRSGTIGVDDISVHYGAPTRGIVVAGNGTETKAVYALKAVNASISVPGSTAQLRQGAALVPVAVSDNAVSGAVGSYPYYISSPIGVSPATTSAAQSVRIRWESGDLADVAIDVLDSSGAVVTGWDRAAYDSGPQVLTWNGRTSTGPVPAGSYRVRFTFFDDDGESSVLTAAFTRSS